MTVKELIARSKAAQAAFAFATQEQADAAARAICKVVYDNAEKLGPMAAEESRMGSEQDKIAKCRNKSALIWESLKDKKSCDIINRIEERRMIEVAKPVGVVASIIPSTNPVVTPMSNGAFALKCRNSVIFAPHPRAVKCTKLLVEMFRAELKKLGLPEGEPLVHPWISKALEKAQQKVEERNFDIRKSLLKYDDVMNEQRKVIYEQRKELMSTDDISDTILDMRHDYLSALIGNSVPEGTAPDEWDIPRLKQDLFNITGINLPVEEWAEKNGIDSVDMVEMITKEVDSQIAAKNAAIPESIIRLVEKSIMLQTLDQLWKDHIATLDLMRHTIVLRAYGQKDPLNEYKREAFNMFSDMLDVLKERVTTIICRTTIQQGSDQDVKEQEQRRQNLKMEAVHESPDGRPQPVAPENRTVSPSTATEHPEWKNISRNSPCPCGSGKKYKHCHGKVA